MRGLAFPLAVAPLLGLAVPSPAAVDAVQHRQGEARATLARSRAAADAAERRSVALAADAARARDAAEADRLAAAALALRIQAAEAAVAASAARSRLAAAALQRQMTRLRAEQAPVLRLVARLQLLSRRPPISLLAEPGAARTIVHNRAILAAVLPQVAVRTRSLRQTIAETRRLAAAQRSARARLAADRARLAERRRELAHSEASRRALATRLGTRSSAEADLAAALARQAADMDDMMRRLGTLSQRRDRLAALTGPEPRPGSLTVRPATLLRPLPGERQRVRRWRAPVLGEVETGFGAVDASGRRASGTTIVASGGAQIVAPAGGHVMFAGPFRSYGAVAIIDHGDGWTSLVTGMLTVAVRVGDRVVEGSPIGRAGPGAPRIGVEIRRRGQPTALAPLIG